MRPLLILLLLAAPRAHALDERLQRGVRLHQQGEFANAHRLLTQVAESPEVSAADRMEARKVHRRDPAGAGGCHGGA